MTQKIRVNFKAFDSTQLDKAVKEIVSIVKRSGANVIGPIPLPTKKQKICVLRSPHVNKKSREQFEFNTHKRLLYITETTPQTMDSLMKLDVSAGVQVDIKLK
ncbi:MAG: 30S ribosomal protein S10 [Proteobacteria bacterium]|jgi:small subunit ribosomal protein S10|nr:30S ribosomal protein S10 [Pseudomonadota bacterium]